MLRKHRFIQQNESEMTLVGFSRQVEAERSERRFITRMWFWIKPTSSSSLRAAASSRLHLEKQRSCSASVRPVLSGRRVGGSDLRCLTPKKTFIRIYFYQKRSCLSTATNQEDTSAPSHAFLSNFRVIINPDMRNDRHAVVVYLSVLTHSALSVSILQSEDLFSPPGVSVALECQMGPGFSMSSFTMLWYRQNRPGAQIQLLLTEYEPTKDHFRASIDGAKNNFTLQIHELSEDDSSIYFCAARHSDAVTAYSHTNKPTAPKAAVGAVV